MKLTRNRNLFNADCNTIFYNPEIWQPEGGRFSKKAIHRFTAALADGGVDTLLINPNAQLPWYPSKVLPSVLDGYTRGDREFVRGHAPNNPDHSLDMEAILAELTGWLDLYLDLVEEGTDWVAEMIVAARQRKLTPWASVRMNDTHGSAAPEASFFNCPLFKNPKYRLSGKLPNPQDKSFVWWIGLNYAFPEVREYYLTQIRELVNDYDFAGLELDWTRHFPLFEMPVTPKNIQTITAFVRDVRALTQARARKTGKRYPLGMRVLSDIDKSRHFGVDVKTLAREGLIDFVVAANHWHTAWDIPIDHLRAELGDQITIYGSTDAIANWLQIPSATHPKVSTHRYLSASAPLARASAAGQLALGADGIERFNFFSGDCVSRGFSQQKLVKEAAALRSDYRGLRGSGKLEQLRGQPKHYAFATTPTDWWMPPHVELAEQLPALIEDGARRGFRLAMAREPLHRGLRATLQIVVEKTRKRADLGISFNGSWPVFGGAPTSKLLFPRGPFQRFHSQHQAFNFPLNLADIRDGWNEIVVYHGGHDPVKSRGRNETVRIVSIELAVQ